MRYLKNILIIFGPCPFFGAIGISITHFYPRAASAMPTRPDAATLYQLTNVERERQGLSDFRLDTPLNQTAAAKCSDMAQHGYIGHDAPDGRKFDSFIRPAHPNAATVAENLAENYDSSSAVVSAWIASPEHQANLDDPRLHTVGFAVCDVPGYTNVVVQQFSSDL